MRPRFVLAAFVSAVPSSAARIALYRLLFGYRIDSRAKIGPFTVIDVSSADIGAARLRGMCLFRGPFRLEIGDRTAIGSWNDFECGEWVKEARFEAQAYARECRIGSDCLITAGHFFDATDRMSIGDRTWIAGRSSQVWTHGAGTEKRSVVIGNDCYIASRVAFAPGSALGEGCLATVGSVIAERFQTKNAIVGGVPAVLIREGWDWKRRTPAA